MPTQPARKLTLIDAMILVAAAALGFAGIRAEQTRHFHPVTNYIERPLEPTPVATSVGGITTTSFASFSIGGPITSIGYDSAWFSTLSRWAGLAHLSVPCLASLSVAMLLIRLRNPRPTRARLVRQAGLVASLGATLALGAQSVLAVLKFLIEASYPTMQISATGSMPSRLSWIACQATQPHVIGVVVLSAWLALAVGARRHERGWIDRIGIAVGLGWVALLLVDLLCNDLG